MTIKKINTISHKDVPENIEEIMKEFNESKNPWFLLKYPDYFRWVESYQTNIIEEYTLINDMKDWL